MSQALSEDKNRDKILSVVVKTFEERIPFNQILGFNLQNHECGNAKLSFKMRDDLVGNFLQGNLHGGVIASSLDVVGGLVAFLALLNKTSAKSIDEGLKHFSKLGTVDLRVDFLRPGLGNSFSATGSILHAGRQIAVARMALHNDSDTLIAVATGTYSIG